MTLKNTLLTIVKYAAIFTGTALLLFLLMVCAACIPESAIHQNLLESSEYLNENEAYYEAIPGENGTTIDHYGDSILMSIQYHMDNKHPVQSVLWAKFYIALTDDTSVNHYDMMNGEQVRTLESNRGLAEDLEIAPEPNEEYLRYWHGSTIWIRPLLTMLNVKQIYILDAVLLCALLLWLLIALCRRKYVVPAFGLLAGLVATYGFCVPMSFNYTWTHGLMLLGCLFMLYTYEYGKPSAVPVGFLVLGILTAFFDFLSNETITFTVPAVLYIWLLMRGKHSSGAMSIGNNDKSSRSDRREAFLLRATEKIPNPSLRHLAKTGCFALLWGCGYVCMWCFKWVLSAIILQIPVLEYVGDHVSERIGKAYAGMSKKELLLASFRLNWQNLFPLNQGIWGKVVLIVLVVVLLYLSFIFPRDYERNTGKIGSKGTKGSAKKSAASLVAQNWIFRGNLLLLGLVPYLRYLVMMNHSAYHYFFTFRAQQVFVMVLLMILLDRIHFETSLGLCHIDSKGK